MTCSGSAPAASWQRVIPLLAPHVRVAAYDRAGLGGSDPAPGLATIDRMTGDLASVITGLGTRPCVLAGHSLGGILVQLLAFRQPGLVAGLVLVDPGHEEQGRHAVVGGTGHNIPRDRPDVVAGTILAVAAQVRAGGG